MIENIEKQKEKISFFLTKQLTSYKIRVPISYYEPILIKSGLIPFKRIKEYIDTSSVEGLNNIDKGENAWFNKLPPSAKMQPAPNTVWFAKMKSSNKNIILSKYDSDIINSLIFSAGFIGIKCSEKLPLSLLSALVLSKEFRMERDFNTVGTTMQRVNNETFMKIMVPKLTDKEIREFEIKNIHLVNRLSFLRRKLNKLNMIKNLLLDKYF